MRHSVVGILEVSLGGAQVDCLVLKSLHTALSTRTLWFGLLALKTPCLSELCLCLDFCILSLVAAIAEGNFHLVERQIIGQ